MSRVKTTGRRAIKIRTSSLCNIIPEKILSHILTDMTENDAMCHEI